MHDKLIELPGWAVADAAAFRRLASRVVEFEFVRAGVAVPRCEHGSNPFTDTCPPCEMEDA